MALGTLIGIFAAVAVAVIVVVVAMTGYVKAPPDKAFIISGFRKKRIVVGKSAIKIPFLERKDELNLQLISIDLKTSSEVPTADYINIKVDAAVNVKINSADVHSLDLASENFLNKNMDYIAQVAREVLEGNTREIIGQMKLEEMVSDRQRFADLVKENAAPDLANMGLSIVNFNVQNFVDKNGVIEDLGVDNIVRIKKDAAISRSDSEREIAIASAKNQKTANDARVAAELEIAKADNELAMKKHDLKLQADVKKAAADSAYQIQQEEQRKTIEVTAANANIAKQEREIELQSRVAEVTEKQLDATIRKEAEAEKFAEQQKADADLYKRQAEADAKKYEEEQAALARKVKAEADRYEAEQIAEGIRAKGEAEAEAIRLKALAEAEGIDKKADAMKKYGEAAVLEMYFAALPEVAKNIASPLTNVDSITMYGEGNTAKLIEDITKSTNQVSEGLLAGTGIDLKALLAGFLGGKVAQDHANG